MEATLDVGTLIADTDHAVITVTGSFVRKVEVNMKKVSKRTVTSLIAVMSMSVLFLFIFTLPIFYLFKWLFLFKLRKNTD